MSAEPGTIASIRVTGARSVVDELGVGVGGERFEEGVEVRRLDREPRGGAVPAEAVQVLGAGRERAVEVERGQ